MGLKGYHTLGQAIELGALGVIVRCGTCLNVRIFTPAHALKLFGAETDDIPARCRVPGAARKPNTP